MQIAVVLQQETDAQMQLFVMSLFYICSYTLKMILISYVIGIAVIHHLASESRRLEAINDISRMFDLIV